MMLSKLLLKLTQLNVCQGRRGQQSNCHKLESQHWLTMTWWALIRQNKSSPKFKFGLTPNIETLCVFLVWTSLKEQCASGKIEWRMANAMPALTRWEPLIAWQMMNGKGICKKMLVSNFLHLHAMMSHLKQLIWLMVQVMMQVMIRTIWTVQKISMKWFAMPKRENTTVADNATI